MKIKAVPYYRVSTARQGQSGLGLEAQRKSVHEFALHNKIDLLDEFIEIESGKKTKRLILEQALEQCRKENAILLIAQLSRLARNVAFISALMEAKVKIKVVDNPHATVLVLHITAAFDEHEREEISIRTKAALQAAKARGVKLGTYGKTLVENKRKAYIAFAKKEAKVIQEIQAQGFLTVREIMNELNKRGIKTFTGGDARWHVSTVHRLLKQIENLK